MGFTDLFADFYASLTAELHADAPPENEEKDEGGEGEDSSKKRRSLKILSLG